MQIPIAGLISLERGFIFTSMILAAMTVCLIEKHYRAAAAWAAVAAAISTTGLMHGYTIANGAIVNAYGPATHGSSWSGTAGPPSSSSCWGCGSAGADSGFAYKAELRAFRDIRKKGCC